MSLTQKQRDRIAELATKGEAPNRISEFERGFNVLNQRKQEIIAQLTASGVDPEHIAEVDRVYTILNRGIPAEGIE